jgi:hypothetical protein
MVRAWQVEPLQREANLRKEVVYTGAITQPGSNRANSFTGALHGRRPPRADQS